jgi:hypothetical protein
MSTLIATRTFQDRLFLVGSLDRVVLQNGPSVALVIEGQHVPPGEQIVHLLYCVETGLEIGYAKVTRRIQNGHLELLCIYGYFINN